MLEQRIKWNTFMQKLFDAYERDKKDYGQAVYVSLLDFSNAIQIPATTRANLMTRTKGEPSAKLPSIDTLDQIAAFAEKYGLGQDAYEAAGRQPRMPQDPMGKALLKGFLKLPHDDREAVLDFMRQRVAERQAEQGDKEDAEKQLAFA